MNRKNLTKTIMKIFEVKNTKMFSALRVKMINPLVSMLFMVIFQATKG